MKHLKQEFDKLTFKEAIVYSMAYAGLIAGFVLLFVGMFTPPEGEIHDSVLTAFGITLIFVSSLLGISMHYSDRSKTFERSIIELLRSYGLQPRDTDNPPSSDINLSK